MRKGCGFLNPKTGQQSKPDLDTLVKTNEDMDTLSAKLKPLTNKEF